MSLQVLSQCPHLQTCCLFVHAGPTGSGVGEPNILELNFLHTLGIEWDGYTVPSTTVGPLLRRLSLPQLRNLKLRGNETTTTVFPMPSSSPPPHRASKSSVSTPNCFQSSPWPTFSVGYRLLSAKFSSPEGAKITT
ncbi:hypothetical protein FB451DRAFT_1193076 [Mycena latifolia]|nr:hypothetical protein FB451DRAFT_1193076 [Mycena latifolia]